MTSRYTQDEANEKLIDQNEKILRALGGSSNRGSYGGNATPSGGGGNLFSGGGPIEKIGGVAVSVADGMDKLWRGTLNVSTGFDSLNSIIGKAGGKLGEAFAGITGTIGHTILDTNNALNLSLKHGANFNNNLTEYDKLIKGARMTHEEYNDMVRNGAEAMRGLGSDINTSQKNFLLMAKSFQEGNIGSSLKELGLHAEDLNEVLVTSMHKRRGMDMSDPATKNAATESAERMLIATEEIARITGQSRKDQLESIKKHDEDAAIQMKISTLDKQGKERFDEGMAKMHMLGPAYEKVFRDSFLGMITKEGSSAMTATGTATADVQRLAYASERGTMSKEQIKALSDTAVARGLDNENSVGHKTIGMYSGGADADMVRQNWGAEGNIREPINALKDEIKNKTGRDIDNAEAFKMLMERTDKSLATTNKDGSSTAETGAVAARTINQADRAISDLTAGSTKQFGQLNDKLGTTVQEFGNLNKVLGPLTQEQADPVARFKDAAKGAAGYLAPDALKDAYDKSKENRTNEKTTPAQLAEPVKPVEKRANGSPSFEGFLNGTGSFDSMFEHFNTAGTPAELHGEELVATRKQMEKFVEKIIPTPKIAQSESNVPVLPSLPPLDFKNILPQPAQTETKTPDAATTATNDASKILSQSLNTVSDRLKELSVALHDFKPLDHVNQVVEKVTAAQKPATPPLPTPAPVVAPTLLSTAKSEQNAQIEKLLVKQDAQVKKEEKPAEVKKEEPKLLNLGIKTAEDLNKFLFGGMPQPKEPTKEDKTKLMEEGKTAESFFKGNAEKVNDQMRDTFNKMAVNPFDKLPVPEIKESQIADALSKKQPLEKHFEELSKTVSSSLTTNRVEKHDESKKTPPVEQKPKAPDVSSLDASLLNIAKFNKAMASGDISKIGMSQMDLSDAGKAAEKKLGPSTASVALQKKREALENASFDYEEMKAAKTKPSAESAERLAKKKEEVAKLSLAYEEDLIKTKGRLNLHAADEVKHAEVKNKNNENEKAQQVAKALADEKKFMKEHGPASADTTKPSDKDLANREKLFQSPTMTIYDESKEKTQLRKDQQAAANDKSAGIFDRFSNFFNKSDKPAFASGNVKYKEIPQAEIDAKNKRMQESIGKIDNSPEAIAAQKAELDRQKNSGLYKQKEPEKPKIEEVKKPAETKEDAQLKEMYKKFGFETFKDYNARVSAEVKQSHAQIKDAVINKKELSPKDVAPPPTPLPKPVESQQPAPQLQQPQVVEKQVTLKDIHDDLMQLNKAIAEMVHHTDQINNNSRKQISATKSLSNSR